MNVLDNVVQDYSFKQKPLNKRVSFLSFESKKIKRAQDISSIDANIDMSFLSMKNEDGSPKFAIFTGDSSNCYISLNIEDSADIDNIQSNIPIKLIKHYIPYIAKVCSKLVSYTGESLFNLNSITISSNFEGVLDDKARSLMDVRSNSSKVKRLLVCEASNWTAEKIELKREFNRDPLVIEYYSDLDCGKLLYKFDTTNVEEYISKEFTC